MKEENLMPDRIQKVDHILLPSSPSPLNPNAMTTKNASVDFSTLVFLGLMALSQLCSATQLSPAELRDPDVYAVCFWGSCFSPPYGKAFCFDSQITPMPEEVIVEAPYKSLLLRGRLISKTTHSAIFFMYETYPMSWGFFDFFDNDDCDEPFCDLQELREIDPAIRDLRRGDRVCVIPLATYESNNSVRSTFRAVEVEDVSRGNLLDCSICGGSAGIISRNSWF